VSAVYQIRIREKLDDCWASRFHGLSMAHEEDGTTVLTGSIPDQAALHGLLIKMRDLGLTLLSVHQTGVPESLCDPPRADRHCLRTDESARGPDA
jgi:hypothetical protein